MKLQEGIEILEKLKPFENKRKMESGVIIERFFLLPMKYIKKENLIINWVELWKYEDLYSKNLIDSKNLDFDIVAVNYQEYGAYLTSKNLEYFKTFLNQENK